MSTPRLVVSSALIIQGTLLALASSDDYSASGYAVVLDIADRDVWGALFFVSGVALLVARHPLSLALCVGTLFAWALGLHAAYWTDDGTTPTAGLSWFVLGVLVLWSSGRPDGIR